MAISKRWVADKENQQAALNAYRDTLKLLTITGISEELGTTYQNVGYVLKHHMPEAERKALKAVRYSASKTGTKNPMRHKCREQHHNWKGLCEDGYGYLTCLHKGRRVFAHRLVMSEALGVEPWELPKTLAVHHIDGDTENNALDNLAVCTHAGHKEIHYLQVKDALSLQLRRSTIAEVVKSMT